MKGFTDENCCRQYRTKDAGKNLVVLKEIVEHEDIVFLGTDYCGEMVWMRLTRNNARELASKLKRFSEAGTLPVPKKQCPPKEKVKVTVPQKRFI